MRNIVEIIKKRSGNVPDKYDMTFEEWKYLADRAKYKNFDNVADIIREAFLYGFEMGVQASKRRIEIDLTEKL